MYYRIPESDRLLIQMQCSALYFFQALLIYEQLLYIFFHSSLHNFNFILNFC